MHTIISLTRDIEHHTIKAAEAKGIVDKEFHDNIVAAMVTELNRQIKKQQRA